MKRISISLLLFMTVLLLSSCTEKAVEAPNYYGSVNGEKITYDEIEYFKTRCRADIVNDFAEKYGITDFSDFWERDFGGVVPSQALEEKAFSMAVDAKLRLVLMRENGVYDDITFSALRQKAENYNAEHKGQSGGVGINSVDMSGFYTYYISTGEMELKNILAEGALKPSNEELKKEAVKNPELTENGLISAVVSEKYDILIKDISENAEINKGK